MNMFKCGNNINPNIPFDKIYELIHKGNSCYSITIPIVFHNLTIDNDNNKIESLLYNLINSINSNINDSKSNYEEYESIVKNILPQNKIKDFLTHNNSLVVKHNTSLIFEFKGIYQYENIFEIQDIYESNKLIESTCAYSIEKSINIWIVDVNDNSVQGISSLPFDEDNGYKGIKIIKNLIFDNGLFGSKVICHHLGHLLGVVGSNYGLTSCSKVCSFNPKVWKDLQHNQNYHPMFMSYAELTDPKYTCLFTYNQIVVMKYYARDMLGMNKLNDDMNIINEDKVKTKGLTRRTNKHIKYETRNNIYRKSYHKPKQVNSNYNNVEYIQPKQIEPVVAQPVVSQPVIEQPVVAQHSNIDISNMSNTIKTPSLRPINSTSKYIFALSKHISNIDRSKLNSH